MSEVIKIPRFLHCHDLIDRNKKRTIQNQETNFPEISQKNSAELLLIHKKVTLKIVNESNTDGIEVLL
tara:strand:+ start:1656 stop:1859 length:204 start_codon:yes stop_codon:yes gene_type:complete